MNTCIGRTAVVSKKKKFIDYSVSIMVWLLFIGVGWSSVSKVFTSCFFIKVLIEKSKITL